MADITIGQAFGYILAFATAMVTLAKAWDWIAARLKPNKELRQKVEEHERMLTTGDKHFDEIDKMLQDQRTAINFTLRSNLALIQHFIDGNSKEAMQKTRDDITKFLVERK